MCDTNPYNMLYLSDVTRATNEVCYILIRWHTPRLVPHLQCWCCPAYAFQSAHVFTKPQAVT